MSMGYLKIPLLRPKIDIDVNFHQSLSRSDYVINGSQKWWETE